MKKAKKKLLKMVTGRARKRATGRTGGGPITSQEKKLLKTIGAKPKKKKGKRY